MPDASLPRGAAEANTGTVSRAMQLLTVVADAQGPVTVKYVADCMKLAPSTAHRLLQLLKKEGFVELAAEKSHYAIGPSFYRVAARVLASVSIASRAKPVIDAIARKFDETVLLGVYLPTQRALSFEDRADGANKLKYQIDMHQPLSLVWGASGKAVLAFIPPDIAKAIWTVEGPSPASNAKPPSWTALDAELAQIRTRGWALSESEKLPDARGIAAPVFGPNGVVGCICLTSPKARMPNASIDAIGLEVASHAKALSHMLGGAAL